MKIYTGDDIGTIKVVDTANQNVEKILKSSKPCRELKVTYMDMLDGRMLICRKGGVVELIEIARPSPPIWAIGVPGCPVFAAFLSPDRLTVLTASGYMMLIDVTKIQPYLTPGATLQPSSADEMANVDINWYADEDPVLAYAHEMVDSIGWNKYVENPKDTFEDEHTKPLESSDSSDSIDDNLSQDDSDGDDDGMSLREVSYSDEEPESCPADSKLSRPEWLIQLRRITSDSLTCGFVFDDSESRACVGAAGKLMPLKVFYYDGDKLQLRFYTLHSGRMVKRARFPKIMCAGYLDSISGMDALYAVDQKGKVRIYFMLELERQSDETERSRGPVITFQGTNKNNCPNIFRVLSDQFHKDVLGLHQDSEDSDEDTQDGGEDTGEEPSQDEDASQSVTKPTEAKTDYELLQDDVNDDIGFVVAEECDPILAEKEDRYLSEGENNAWFFAVGDAKGGCFILRLDMFPGTALYHERVRRFETDRVRELYERTKRARRMKIHVDYTMGQLIDTSPLDRGDYAKHDKFNASLRLQVTDTFKLIPGAISSMDYDDGKMVLAGLDRRLYIHKKTGAVWFRTHKINLKGKLTSVVTSS